MDNRKREFFEQTTKKQLKYSRLAVLLTFGILGAVFVALGAIFLLCDVRDTETGQEIWYIFLPMGAFWIFLGGLLYAILPRSYNYDRFARRIKRYGALNLYDLYATVQLQQKEIEELRSRVSRLDGQYDRPEDEYRDSGYDTGK